MISQSRDIWYIIWQDFHLFSYIPLWSTYVWNLSFQPTHHSWRIWLSFDAKLKLLWINQSKLIYNIVPRIAVNWNFRSKFHFYQFQKLNSLYQILTFRAFRVKWKSTSCRVVGLSHGKFPLRPNSRRPWNFPCRSLKLCSVHLSFGSQMRRMPMSESLPFMFHQFYIQVHNEFWINNLGFTMVVRQLTFLTNLLTYIFAKYTFSRFESNVCGVRG